jgi:hypothetical protein
LVNYPPKDSYPDLAERVMIGIERAKYNRIFIVEDDDYYPDTFFADLLKHNKFDFIGYGSTIYYHVGRRAYIYMNHPTHAGLFTTGLLKDALDLSVFHGNVFLDIRLWEYARKKNSFLLLPLKKDFPIGIKHGIGLCGGAGHRPDFKYSFPDENWEWLKSHVREESFNFYQKIWHTLNNKSL